MAKLRHLEAKAFRGARFKVPLDFSKTHKSLAIFGDNASGKSTITDALEWFIHDRIGHLWREDCKQESLRHFLARDDDDCTVEVRFEGKDLGGIKSLSVDIKTTSSSNDDTRDLVGELRNDNIFLRHSDVVEFLDKSKGNKREAIAQIIGYEEFTRFRSVIQQTRNSLQRDGIYQGAKQQSESLQSKMVVAVGQVVPDRKAFLDIAKHIMAPFSLETVVADEPSYVHALEELRRVGRAGQKVKLAERLAQVSKFCDELRGDIDTFTEAAVIFKDFYNTLAKERESVDQLRLSEFLSKGNAVIAEDAYTISACPFCLSPYDLAKLQAEVAHRLSKMAELQGKLDRAKGLKDALIETVRTVGIKARTLAEEDKIEHFDALIDSAADATLRLRKYYSGVGRAFDTLAVFEPPEGFDKTISTLRDHCQAGSEQAQEAIKKLDLTELEKQVAATLSKLETLGNQVRDYENAQRIIDATEAQILTLSTIFDEFIDVQNATFQGILDTISEDVGAFYSALHPNESVDRVRLAMVGDEGVEFEYFFHGKKTHPPRKYLSESHLNSLGVVLFLANARNFNKRSKFLVLDDIVTSFDTGHRRRLLRLLRDEFSDWQIIILTHENIWFSLIKKEMAQSDWLFKEIMSDDTNGILMDGSPATLKDIIEVKRGKNDVTNDLRKLLEGTLKEICSNLAVKVEFRFNENNEKRMSGELLDRLRATLREKSSELSKNSIFPDLAGSTLIANIDSHDNPDKITNEDIDVFLDDIERLASLFICGHCHRHIQADSNNSGAKEISCRCGKATIPWKS